MPTLLLPYHSINYDGTFVNFRVNIHILVHVHLCVDGYILLLYEGIQFWIKVGGLKSECCDLFCPSRVIRIVYPWNFICV